MRIADGSTIDCLLFKVDITLPNDHVHIDFSAYPYEEESEHVDFSEELTEWFASHDLEIAPEASDLLMKNVFAFAIERRVHSQKRFSLQNLSRNTDLIRFWFKSSDDAMLFKLTWA